LKGRGSYFLDSENSPKNEEEALLAFEVAK
jgi:hypothetical protein